MNNRTPRMKNHPIPRRAVTLGMTAFAATGLAMPSAFAQDFDMGAALAPRIIGDANAPIHIAEYFSLSCGHCADFHAGTYRQLRRDWIDTGRVRFEYRDFPLGQPALYAHALARAVRPEGYETMLDMLFTERARWLGGGDLFEQLAGFARSAGIGRGSFDAIMGNRAYLEGIVAIAIEGRDEWDINSTPSFVINGDDVLRGNLPYDDFTRALESATA